MSGVNDEAYICKSGSILIFACSGGSDVGEIADQTARKLDKNGAGKMFCLAGIGGWVDWIIGSTDSAAKILVIDGCPMKCAKRTMEHSGFDEFEHFCLADLGLKKGESPVTQEIIEAVVSEIKGLCLFKSKKQKGDTESIKSETDFE